MARAFSRADDSLLARWWWTVDRVSLAAFGALMLLGLMLVATASPTVAERISLPPYYFLFRHAVLLGPCAFAVLGLSALGPRWLCRGACLLLVAALAGLVAVLFTGGEVKGAQRWLSLAGQSVQPSEFAKPALIVVTAWAVTRPYGVSLTWGRRAAVGLWAVTVALLLAQPDLGSSVQITAAVAAVAVLAGAPLRLAGFGLAAGAGGLVAAYHALPHVRSRVDRFWDPASGDTYQVDRSLEALSSGGFFGVGPGHGAVKARLPDAHADFMLAVAGEEMGAVLVWAVLALFALILWRGYARLAAGQDMFAVLAGGGLLALLGVQVATHAGSALALIPAKGTTLPFLSYGGSALLSASLTRPRQVYTGATARPFVPIGERE
jgi:cell division protein FtsW